MNAKHPEILFEEDLSFFWKKKLKKLGLGSVLLIVPPIVLYYMFFYLLYWSSLFEKETGLMLIFLVLAPLAGIYFIIKGLAMRRLRIYYDRIPNPVLVGKRFIPLKHIGSVAVILGDEKPWKVELYLKNESDSTRDKHIPLGEFLERDRTDMLAAFRKGGVETKLMPGRSDY